MANEGKNEKKKRQYYTQTASHKSYGQHQFGKGVGQVLEKCIPVKGSINLDGLLKGNLSISIKILNVLIL